MDPSTLMYTEVISLAYYVERCHTEMCKPCRHPPHEKLPNANRVNQLTPLVFCKKHLERTRKLMGMRVYRSSYSVYPARYPCDLGPDRDQIVYVLSKKPPPWFRSKSNFTFPASFPPTFSDGIRDVLGWGDPTMPGVGRSALIRENINCFHISAVLGWNGSAKLGCELPEAEVARMKAEMLADSKMKRVCKLNAASPSRKKRAIAVRRTLRAVKTKQLRTLKAKRDTEQVLKRLACPERPKPKGFVPQGLDLHGPDLQGLNPQGLNLQAVPPQVLAPHGSDLHGFEFQGFQPQGLDLHGFEFQGFQAQGLNLHGFEFQGFQAQGFQAQGFQPQLPQPPVPQPPVPQLPVSQHQGLQHHGFQHQGLQHQGFQPQGFLPQMSGDWDWSRLC